MERLKRRSDFRAAAQAAAREARVSARAFILQAHRRAEVGPPRVGFTVSKQVGNAVERNRVRRRLREMVRLAGTGTLQVGHDYVLIGRRAALNRPFGEMVQDLAGAVRRIHASAPEGTGAVPKRPLHEARSPAGKRSPPARKPPQAARSER